MEFLSFSLAANAQLGLIVDDDASAFGGSVMILDQGSQAGLPQRRTFSANRVGVVFNTGPAPTGQGFNLRYDDKTSMPFECNGNSVIRILLPS